MSVQAAPVKIVSEMLMTQYVFLKLNINRLGSKALWHTSTIDTIFQRKRSKKESALSKSLLALSACSSALTIFLPRSSTTLSFPCHFLLSCLPLSLFSFSKRVALVKGRGDEQRSLNGTRPHPPISPRKFFWVSTPAPHLSG